MKIVFIVIAVVVQFSFYYVYGSIFAVESSVSIWIVFWNKINENPLFTHFYPLTKTKIRESEVLKFYESTKFSIWKIENIYCLTALSSGF